MKIKESMDKYYGTIKIKMQSNKKDTKATFETNVDEYKVTLTADNNKEILIAGESVRIPMCTIMFSSQAMSMGHSQDAGNMADNLYVYPTVLKIIQLYANERRKRKQPVFAFTCSVSGDNARGSKRKIYELLFNKAPLFGYHRWKKELIAIPLDLYDRIKTEGFQNAAGQIVFDTELR